jgi:hypothetical protein
MERSFIEPRFKPIPKRFFQLLSAQQFSHISIVDAHDLHIFLQQISLCPASNMREMLLNL